MTEVDFRNEKWKFRKPIHLLLFHFSDTVIYPQVLIAVQSAPKNTGNRDEIRRTWGKRCKTIHQDWCSLIFVLGRNPISNITFQKNKIHSKDFRLIFRKHPYPACIKLRGMIWISKFMDSSFQSWQVQNLFKQAI